jgi:hypothetical protein
LVAMHHFGCRHRVVWPPGMGLAHVLGSHHATSHQHGVGVGACFLMANMHETHMYHVFCMQQMG